MYLQFMNSSKYVFFFFFTYFLSYFLTIIIVIVIVEKCPPKLNTMRFEYSYFVAESGSGFSKKNGGSTDSKY